jgi:shikimate dehydrogenase
VLVLGAGGSCRAVLAALLWEAATPPPSITLAVRDVAKAAPLHQELSTWCQSLPQPPQAHCVPLAALDETVLSTVGLVVNTTPVGMWPHAEACPLTPAQLAALPPHAVVVDLIYKPAQTALLAQAAARGLATQNGLGMLIHQAIEAFACWLQLSPSATQRTTWASALQLQLGQQLALAMQQPNAPNR